MSPFDILRPNRSATKIANRDELLARYKRLRSVTFKLNHRLVSSLSKKTLDQGGRKLGILRKNVFVFNTEDESSVLMDYCIYDVRSRGRNAIEQYLIDSPPGDDSDEMTCLRAMQDATYSIFVIESVEPGLGIVAMDIRTLESIFIVDISFSTTAEPGVIFASRMLKHDEFSITSGASLPLGIWPRDRPESEQKKAFDVFTELVELANDGSYDPAPVIRACLEKGVSSHVRYEDASETPARHPAHELPRPFSTRERPVAALTSSKVKRNSPCPCGSGRKFKYCCKRRK